MFGKKEAFWVPDLHRTLSHLRSLILDRSASLLPRLLALQPDPTNPTRRRGAERWSAAQMPADGGSPFERWVELSSAGRTDPENVRAALELSALAEAANLSAQEGRPVRPGELP